MKTSGWRGSESIWLDAAHKMLVESGVDSVKIMALAKTLKMSRTSFYWHFQDRDALLTALISRWREKNTGNLISQTQIPAETITESVLNLFDCWVNPDLFDAQLDFAIRNWARKSPELMTILDQTDQERIEAIAGMFSRFDFDPENAHVRAHTIYYTQVGYIAMKVVEPMEGRVDRMPTYIKAFTDSYPSKSEMDKFRARQNQNIAERS